MKRLLLLIIAGAMPLLAAPCTTAPLNNYTTTGFSCTLGGFTFLDFSFAVGSMSSGYTPLGASGIQVTPLLTTTTNGQIFDLSFTSTGFSAVRSEFVNYDIRYNIDPPPDVLIETDDTLLTNTPVYPGFANVTTNVCVGGKWVALTALTCDSPGTIGTLTVFHDGTGSPGGPVKLTDRLVFAAPVHIVGVDNIIQLNANGASSSITGIDNATTATPEPASLALVIGGLALIGARSLRAKRSKVLFQL